MIPTPGASSVMTVYLLACLFQTMTLPALSHALTRMCSSEGVVSDREDLMVHLALIFVLLGLHLPWWVSTEGSQKGGAMEFYA